jgi:ABC-type nitrate/sulfonate/bicarbonate transport system permease component
VKLSRRLAQRLIQLGILAAVLAVWYLVTLPGRINPLLLPAPLPVLADFGALVTTRGIWADLFITVSEWVVAFTIAAAAACVIGYFVSRSAYAVAVFDPLFAGLYSVPAILLFPLYLLFFGLGPGSKIALGTTIAFFPIVLNTIAGLSFVDRSYVTAARSMGASGMQLFGLVMLPAAFPVILTGFRLGSIIAFLAILGAETISSLGGLGHRIVSLAENMESAQMFANILFAILIAVVINFALSYAEARSKRWAR